MGRAFAWLLVAGALASAGALLGGCEDEAPPAPLGTGGEGGGTGAHGGSGAGSAQDAAAAIAACLAQMGQMMGQMGPVQIECPDPGNTMFGWAFDHMADPVSVTCGHFGGDLQISARYTVETDGVRLHALRLRPGGWETPDDGTWLEFMPATPVVVTNMDPLPASLEGWTASVISRTEDRAGAGGAGGVGGNMGNQTPSGLGWLFDQMESGSVVLSLGAPLTADEIVNGADISIQFTVNGGDYLLVDQESDQRALSSEAGAVGEGCIHGGLNAQEEIDDLRATPCGPSFDSCSEGTQVCNVNSGHTIMVCEPVNQCEGACPFSCGAIGNGYCGD